MSLPCSNVPAVHPHLQAEEVEYQCSATIERAASLKESNAEMALARDGLEELVLKFKLYALGGAVAVK